MPDLTITPLGALQKLLPLTHRYLKATDSPSNCGAAHIGHKWHLQQSLHPLLEPSQRAQAGSEAQQRLPVRPLLPVLLPWRLLVQSPPSGYPAGLPCPLCSQSSLSRMHKEWSKAVREVEAVTKTQLMMAAVLPAHQMLRTCRRRMSAAPLALALP